MYLCQRKVKYLNQVVVSCLMTILSVTLVAMVWTPFEVVVFVTQDQQSLLLPAIPFLVLVMLDLCIFVPVLRLKWLSLLDARQLAGATSIGGDNTGHATHLKLLPEKDFMPFKGHLKILGTMYLSSGSWGCTCCHFGFFFRDAAVPEPESSKRMHIKNCF